MKPAFVIEKPSGWSSNHDNFEFKYDQLEVKHLGTSLDTNKRGFVYSRCVQEFEFSLTHCNVDIGTTIAPILNQKFHLNNDITLPLALGFGSLKCIRVKLNWSPPYASKLS